MVRIIFTYMLLLLGAGVPRDTYVPELKRKAYGSVEPIKEKVSTVKNDKDQFKKEELAPTLRILYAKKMYPKRSEGC